MSRIGAVALAIAMGALASACAPRPGEAAAADHAAGTGPHPGEAAYQQWCASCHDNGAETGAPSLAAIRTLNRATVKYALELGYMSQLAKDVPQEDLAQLISWIPTTEAANDAWVDAARCPVKAREVKLGGAARTSLTFGVTNDAHRAQSAGETGLLSAHMKDLEVAWVAAFPQTPTMRSQPVIVGETIFIAATDAGRLYALDTNTGCVKWHYVSDMTLRSSLSFAEMPGGKGAIVMGDAAGKVHAVDAQSGRALWITDVKMNNLNRITGAPVVHDGKVLTPISVIESNFPPDDGYECCKGQGAVTALDLATGKQLWLGRTIDEDAKPTRLGRTGTQQYGPAGAMVWSTPTVDPKRNLVYIGTGENLSWPATDTSDAIIAYDIDTGAKRWVFQATKADIWNSACGRRGANCDWPGDYHSPDHDFGATAMLIKRKDGTELVIAGQKSGVVWALNPDNGQLVWSNKIGRGSAMGGVHWGLAYDAAREMIFVPMNDPAAAPDNPNSGSGMHALDARTGAIAWSYKPNDRDCGAMDLPVAQAYVPSPEWRHVPIAAPILPPPPRITQAPVRPVATPAAPPRAVVPTEGASRTPAAPRPAASARCRIGMSPAPLLVDGAVVTGTAQGMLRIFDGASGKVLFEYMTNRPFEPTVTNVAGHGGGLDSAPYIAGDGTLFVQSGYARFGQPPGNVLIAFRPKMR